MATTTMTTVDSILKEVYEGSLNDQLQSETLTLKRIEKSSEGVTHEVGGKYVTFPIRTQRNHGMGARSENTALPAPGTQSYSSARVNLKYLYGALALTGQTFELADKDFQAFATVLDQEVNGIKEGLAKDTNRQVYGDGTGTLATATASGSTTTLVTTNVQYLEPGMIVDVYASDLTTQKFSNVTINTISASSPYTVTFSSTGTSTVSGDVIVRQGSISKEITGLAKIVAASGAVYNIDPSSVPVWKSTVNSNGGTNRALSEGLMIQIVDTIRTLGGGNPTVIFTSLGVRRAYFNLLVQQRRVTNTQEFSGGFKGLAFTTDAGDIPVVSDFDAPPNKMWFINEKEVKLYQAGDWEFMNRDGSNWNRIVTTAGTFDAYEARLYKYCEIGTHRRNAHALLSDITEG